MAHDATGVFYHANTDKHHKKLNKTQKKTAGKLNRRSCVSGLSLRLRSRQGFQSKGCTNNLNGIPLNGLRKSFVEFGQIKPGKRI